MAINESPVTLPPGRAKLSTSPLPTGSESATTTMGMVLVACFATFAPSPVTATIMSTLLSTSSCASARNRLLGATPAFQFDVLAFEVTKIVKCFRQGAQIDLFLPSVGGVP